MSKMVVTNGIMHRRKVVQLADGARGERRFHVDCSCGDWPSQVVASKSGAANAWYGHVRRGEGQAIQEEAGSSKCGKCGRDVSMERDRAKRLNRVQRQTGGWDHILCPSPERRAADDALANHLAAVKYLREVYGITEE